MYSNNIVEILKAMPNVKKAYFLPFHIDHTKKFEGIINYETKTISLADRIGYLDVQSKSGPAITAFVNNVPVAVFGCVILWNGVGEAWSVFSEKARRYPIAMTKGAISFFDIVQILFNLHRLQITVNCNDKRAVSWAKYLKFESEGIMKKYSADKDDTYIMRRK
jgi:hypothetical protein|tara:strand:- start:2931 stop:3422 length:492 start_codon:yes stop_codon:yes gene_type:complete